MTKEFRFLVGGEWRESGEKMYIANPFNGTAVGLLSLAQEEDADEAIRNSAEIFSTLKNLSSYERSKILSAISDDLERRRDEFAEMIANESGKPIRFAKGEVDRAVSTFHIASEEATRIEGEVISLDVSPAFGGMKNRKGITTRFPIGPIVCITPFNFPLNLIAHKIAPAIACGNPFIVKPPPQAPLTSLLLGETLLKSGLPKQAVNIVPCSNDVAEKLATDDRVKMLSFTGSARVGWTLKQKAGKKKILLELGGNAAVIVDRNADLDYAVERCVTGSFAQAGQVCIKVQRMYVHKSVFKQFEMKFLEAAAAVKVGNPLEEDTIVGPMISLAEAERVESWVKEAVSDGATLLWGGKRRGSMIEPTVLGSVNPEMKVCREEIFGPVTTLHNVDSVEDAVEEVNDSRYGLQAGIFSADMKAIFYAYKNLEVGGVIVNDYPTFRVDNMPYGGVKDSGFGREGIKYAIEEMTEPRLLAIEF
ncbi:MAG: aldehyde dehydrogenase family protein [Bacteroidota bacterium]|nr:aldehyde dehydrogenase family protein [Bacteroidota bacterium]